MGWFKYRTIRGELTAALLLLELLFTVMFALVLTRADLKQIHAREQRRVEYQTHLLAMQASYALARSDLDSLARTVRVMRTSPSIQFIRITDPHGRPVDQAISALGGAPAELTSFERAQLHPDRPLSIFHAEGVRESVAPLREGETLLGYCWIREDPRIELAEVRNQLRLTILVGLLGIVVCVVASDTLARTITRPLAEVLKATRRLIRDPETKVGFPILVRERNEAAEVAHALNLLVLAMGEQRAGLNDTLALLDSMLAYAPIGFAFFDRKRRFVRVNRFLSERTGKQASEFLGKSLAEIFPSRATSAFEEQLDLVFEGGEALADLEFETNAEEQSDGHRSWLFSLYPVKIGQGAVRWVGAVAVDTTERRRSEEALRRTEKLAATGRLAASIAHEINNPLEAVTNLLFLLRSESSLSPTAADYAAMAAHQVSRVSEITQQTLRFYRQSTLPSLCSVPELLDSMLTLHQGRLHAQQIHVEKRYRGEVSLFGYSGALRQVFANLIGNAIDAMASGGKLLLAVRYAHSAKNGAPGVRVTIADTGSGMHDSVKKRIFEPFFTTKEATGTGLGLWVSLEIVEKHRGVVDVRSRCKENSELLFSQDATAPYGTVFVLFFPCDGVPQGEPDQGRAASNELAGTFGPASS